MTNPLSADRWQRIENLLHRALDAEPAQRAAMLDRECGSDAALRAELDSLLAASAADSALEHGPAVQSTPALPPQELPPGTRLGAWELRDLIGRGGMGEVYAAQRADGSYTQQVAVKVLRAEANKHLDRFHAERRILARLEHPGIARLLDSALTPDGRPAMVMEFVQGAPLLDYAGAQKLDLAQRLALFQQVCDAVAFAHASLVIHRDLKPGNVLVSAEGRAKLLDFGVAKLLDPSVWGESTQTLTRLAPLTPGHAAPEQLQGQAVTTATDVYALGIILYELLTGRAPWQLEGLPMTVALNKLLREEPPPASTQPGCKPLRGDLDAILARALKKEARERYPTVAALRSDLERYLKGEPVAARPDSEWYRLRKFIRRNRMAVAVAALVLLMAAGFVVRVIQAEHRASEEARAAQAVADYVVSLFEAASPEVTGGKPIEPRKLVDEGRKRLDEQLKDQPALRGRMLGTLSEIYLNLGLSTEGEVTAQQALDELRAQPDARPQALAALHNQLGQHQYMLGKGRAARDSFTQALALLDQAGVAADAPARADPLLHLGLAERHHGDPQLGLQALERALVLLQAQGRRQEEAAALTYLSEAYGESGQLDQALQASDRALKLTAPAAGQMSSSIHLMALSYRNGVLQARGDWDEAERISRWLVEEYTRLQGPDSDWASNRRYWLAVLLYERGKQDEALKFFLEDAASARRAKRSGLDLALCLIEPANALRAVGRLDEALALHAEIEPILEALALENPESTRPQYGRYLYARTLIAKGELARVPQLLAQDVPEGERERRALRRLVLAEYALAQGRTADALTALDEAQAQNPPPLALPREIAALRQKLLPRAAP